jgi:hypothetical protein
METSGEYIMIGILKFKLPEERQEFYDAQRSGEVIGGLQEFDNYLRGIVKHGTDIKDVEELATEIRHKLSELVPYIWGE